jgi:hypothetical protein
MRQPKTPSETGENSSPTETVENSPPTETVKNSPLTKSNLGEILEFLRTEKGIFLASTFMVASILGLVAIAFLANKIEIVTGAGTIIVKNGNTQNSVFNLSPTGGSKTPWVKTGIKVKKGDKIKITASGRVHTSLKRLIAEAQNHAVDPAYLPWVGPEGLQQEQEDKLQSTFPARRSYKVLPDKNGAYYGYGMLLAGVRNPRQEMLQENIEPIGISHDFQTKYDGELELTVNDVWLDESMENTYIVPIKNNFEYYKSEAHFHATLIGENFSTWSKETEKKKANEAYKKRKQSWQAVVKHRAWGVWYEDNTGSFSVSITVN